MHAMYYVKIIIANLLTISLIGFVDLLMSICKMIEFSQSK